VRERGVAILAAWNDFAIALNRHALAGQLQGFEQAIHVGTGVDVAGAAIDAECYQDGVIRRGVIKHGVIDCVL